MKEKFKKPQWAIDQIIREDRGGLVEDLCHHGIGHPNREWLAQHGNKNGCDSIHGCCHERCCQK